MTYTVFATPSAQRAMHKLPQQVRIYLENEVTILETYPLTGEQLQGKLRFLRSLHTKLNNVEYRVVYEVSERNHEVLVHYAGPRENFYKRLEKMRLKKAA